MRPTETSAAVLAKPSEVPVIRAGQTAVNGIGWNVERLTPKGWQPILWTVSSRDEAEAFCEAMTAAAPNYELRVYEALEGWA